MAYVAIFTPHLPVRRVSLETELTIGRSDEARLAVNDPKLSRMHCRIVRDPGGWLVIDDDSTNGTFVDGQRVARHELHDGGSFKAGQTKFVFYEGILGVQRPIDPIEAASRASAAVPADDASATTLVDQRLPSVRINLQEPVSRRPQKPLAFTRPPARPIVQPQSVPAQVPEPGSRGIAGLLGRFRKR